MYRDTTPWLVVLKASWSVIYCSLLTVHYGHYHSYRCYRGALCLNCCKSPQPMECRSTQLLAFGSIVVKLMGFYSKGCSLQQPFGMTRPVQTTKTSEFSTQVLTQTHHKIHQQLLSALVWVLNLHRTLDYNCRAFKNLHSYTHTHTHTHKYICTYVCETVCYMYYSFYEYICTYTYQCLYIISQVT